MNGAKILCRTTGSDLVKKSATFQTPDTWSVLYPELASLDPVLKPMKAHVAGLGHLRLDGPVGQAHGDLNVTMNCRGGLGVPEVCKHLVLKVLNLRGSKRAPYSASCTEEQTTGMRVEWTEMEELKLKKVGSLDRARWWNDPATLPALGRDRNEASGRTRQREEHRQQRFQPGDDYEDDERATLSERNPPPPRKHPMN